MAILTAIENGMGSFVACCWIFAAIMAILTLIVLGIYTIALFDC